MPHLAAGSAECVRLENLAFHYASGDFLLRADELTIARGEHTVIVGPSGSGKTTLLHLMAGILEPDSGNLTVVGQDLPRSSDRQRREFRISRVGMIFQEFELLDHLSVRENILLPYFVHPTLRLDATTEEHLRSLTVRAGLGKLMRRKPRGLSQGERQRVAICRALITRPPLILADEPTGNLDPDTTHVILDSIFEEVRENDATLIMVTHDHSLLHRFDRVLDFETFRKKVTP